MKAIVAGFGAALVPLALAAGLPGCTYSSAQQQEASACQILGPKTPIGGALGAAGGAAIGGAVGGGNAALIGAGAGLLAGLVGGHIADQQDCAAAQAALQAQLFDARSGGTIAWSSPSGHQGQYREIGVAYAGPNSATCRRADSLPAAGSGETSQPLVVCRTPDGNYHYSAATGA
jgi:hypothetical protein